MEELLKAEKYEEVAAYCEDQEFKAPQCVPSAEIYGILLGVYLVQNELDHAKLLWQRMPQHIKQEHKEICELWEIGKKLWRKEFAAIYEVANNPKWPPYIKPLVSKIVVNVRMRVLILVSKSYSSISLGELCSLLGQSEKEVKEVVTEKSWGVDGQASIIRPKPLSAPESTNPLEHQEKLQQLTKIISFLEN